MGIQDQDAGGNRSHGRGSSQSQCPLLARANMFCSCMSPAVSLGYLTQQDM